MGRSWSGARCPIDVCREFHRFSFRKPVWTKLLPLGKAGDRSYGFLAGSDELPEGVERCETNPFWEIVAECLEFELLFKRASPAPRHINISEVRSFLLAERELGKPRVSIRDLGCLIKGRSALKGPNRELKKSVGSLIVFDFYPSFMYFELSKNPADDPTRGVLLRCKR